MRKFIFFAAVCMALAALSGCAGKTEAVESDDVTIVKIMKPGSIRDFGNVLSEFSEENPDIRVKFVDAPTGTLERHALYVSAMSGRDSSVDIYWLNDEWISEFARYGYINPLDDTFNAEHEKNIIDTKKCFEYENRLYALPVGIDTDILYYRNDELPNLPEKWDKPDESGFEGICAENRDGADMIYNIVSIKRSTGLSYARALDLYGKLISGTGTGDEDAASAFKTGKTKMFLGKASDYAEMNSSASSIKGKFSVMSDLGGDGGRFVTGYGMGINANSKNIAAAVRVLEFMNNADVQKQLARSCSLMPVIRSLYDDEMVLYDNPHFKELVRTAENAVLYSSLDIGGERLVRLNNAVNTYLSGGSDENTAGAVFEEELN